MSDIFYVPHWGFTQLSEMRILLRSANPMVLLSWWTPSESLHTACGTVAQVISEAVRGAFPQENALKASCAAYGSAQGHARFNENQAVIFANQYCLRCL